MKLSSPQKDIYAKERFSAIEAQRLAQEIAFAPVVFQISRLMIKLGVFQFLLENREGVTFTQIVEHTKLSPYATQILIESSLTTGTILLKNEKFYISKVGYFLQNDKMARVNIDFNHDVNYVGLFDLEKSLIDGMPAGLSVFGSWKTIYEGLSQLPEEVKKSWFAFDHYYSDCSFSQALDKVFMRPVKKLLDVGGNTGRFALRCVEYNNEVEVTILDLPQQLEQMKKAISGKIGEKRIFELSANVLDQYTDFPNNFDAIWMSQFLDCFSNQEVFSILQRATRAMDKESRLYIMETVWDRQRFETASFCLTQISVYFTAMANGNSKMFYSQDLEKCIVDAGLEIETIVDELGMGHSLYVCKRS